MNMVLGDLVAVLVDPLGYMGQLSSTNFGDVGEDILRCAEHEIHVVAAVANNQSRNTRAEIGGVGGGDAPTPPWIELPIRKNDVGCIPDYGPTAIADLTPVEILGNVV